MPLEPCSAPELDSLAWREVQERVRTFRQALLRGERPAIEVYAPEGSTHRKAVLLELVHEEMEVRIKAGEHILRSTPTWRGSRTWRPTQTPSSSWSRPSRHCGGG